MKKKKLKTTLIWGLLILWIASFWFVIYEKLDTDIYIQANFIADFYDDRKILWFSDNGFTY